MKNALGSLTLVIVLLFAALAIAADKVVVVPLGGSSNPNVVDTSSGDATADDILKGKKAWVQGIEVIGTLEFCDQAFLDKGEWDCDYYCDLQGTTAEKDACKGGCGVMQNYFEQRCP